ncbi:MAG: restriction endonuclease subunit S [Ignavibacteriota bacterium]
MKTLLKHIANIQTGIYAQTVKDGEIVYLKANHFDENGKLISSLHPDIRATDVTGKHLLRAGDVLFSAKGTKNFATWYENKNLPAVASTSFFVIRLNDSSKDIILPEFLVWFINHPSSQKFLKERAIGTSIVSISKSVIGELELSIPDIQTQKIILNITQLRSSEKRIKQKIETLREKQIQQQILNGII